MTWGQCCKTFYGRNLQVLLISQCWSLTSFSSLVLTSKAAAYSSEAPSGAPLLGRLHILPTNIGIGWKGLSQGNTGSLGAFVQKFYNICPWAKYCKTFFKTIFIKQGPLSPIKVCSFTCPMLQSGYVLSQCVLRKKLNPLA